MSRTCLVCGRYLPSLRSQAIGMGRTCRRRERLAKSFKEPQRVRAREALRAGDVRRLRRLKGGNSAWLVKSGDHVYRATRETCTCKSNVYRLTARNCWHTLAVAEKEV